MAAELPHTSTIYQAAFRPAVEVKVVSEEPAAGLLVVLSGPSGVGKDAVMDRLRQQCYPLRFTVTATTRSPRKGEVHGKDYFFVSNEEFDRMVAEDALLEWAVVHGNRYGVPREQVRKILQGGEDVLMRVDVQGSATIKRKVPGAVLIFLAPPSMEVLVKRLSGRGTETAEQLRTRIDNAVEEMKRLPDFDYCVVNQDDGLAEAVEKVKAIIVAEKCRVHRRQAVV